MVRDYSELYDRVLDETGSHEATESGLVTAL
jgi:hypothetical protein